MDRERNGSLTTKYNLTNAYVVNLAQFTRVLQWPPPHLITRKNVSNLTNSMPRLLPQYSPLVDPPLPPKTFVFILHTALLLMASSSFLAVSANLTTLPNHCFSRLLPYITLTRPVRPHFTSLNLKTESENLRWRTPASMAEIITPKSREKVQVFDSEEDLAVSLAKYTADLANKFSQQGKDSFTVVLSGGSLVKSLRKLVKPPYIDSVDWSKWHVFWVDERIVPKDHPDSNYFLAYNDFLSKIPIPSGNVYAINDALSVEGAADDYETCLKHLVKSKIIDQSEDNRFPRFDLMLLGMGPDGHIASLFPGHHLVQEKEKWVAFIKDSPKPPPERITFTLPVINSSANVALVVAGAGKANPVHAALNDDSKSDLLPVQLVAPEGELSWFLDKGAASML